MEIVVAAYAVVIVIHCFAGMWKMARWNNDPRQQQLVQLLIAAARSGDISDWNNVLVFLSKQGGKLESRRVSKATGSRSDGRGKDGGTGRL